MTPSLKKFAKANFFSGLIGVKVTGKAGSPSQGRPGSTMLRPVGVPLAEQDPPRACRPPDRAK
jgi:hypothetical protein